MFDQHPTLEMFFQQLGLDSSPEAIDEFIKTHQLAWTCLCTRRRSGRNPSMIS